MSTIETFSPQKSKEYDGRKQDHGDAAQRKGHEYEYPSEIKYDRRGIESHSKQLLKSDLSELDIDYASMSPAELEAEADDMLKEYSTGATTAEVSDDEYTHYQDFFPTEAELGVKSKHEIGREMARRVTLDVDYEDDDTGDSDYHIPVRIKNRL